MDYLKNIVIDSYCIYLTECVWVGGFDLAKVRPSAFDLIRPQRGESFVYFVTL